MSTGLQRQIGMLLRVLRLKAGVDQGLLAARLGVSQPTVSRYEAGLSQPSAAHTQTWVELCGAALPTDQRGLAAEAGQALAALLQPGPRPDSAVRRLGTLEHALVLGEAGQHHPGRAADQAGPFPVPPHLLARDPGCFSWQVAGASMEPVLADGDLVVVSPRAVLTDGCLVAAWVEPAGLAILQYRPLAAGGAVLLPANPAYPPVVHGLDGCPEVRIAGRVILQQREL